MREILKMAASDVLPPKERIRELAGMPSASEPRARVEDLIESALEMLAENAEPRGLFASVSTAEFAGIYRGDGRNDPETPLGAIFPEADSLALFAVTLGEPLSARIHELFDAQDFAHGYMLDAAASEGVEKAGELLEQHYLRLLRRDGTLRQNAGLLRYSPGYCGWHMSGQKTLFAFLHPGQIGLTLGESFLMQPLKSMSGVMVVGRREIHKFGNNYPFCVDCQDWSCRERIRDIMGRKSN